MNKPKKPEAGIITDKMSYAERLFHYSYTIGLEEPHFLAFRGLQRLNIVRLQNELAKKKGVMWTNMTASDDVTQDLTSLLHQYDQSLIPVDPLRIWLKARLPSQLTYTKRDQLLRTDEYLKGEPPEQVSPFVDKLARFTVAIAGGLSLVGPMLIMRIGENLTKSLVTTSVAVVLFAGITSLVLRANNTETVAVTATFAAVLVVFVGTSGG